jgi:farnesyl diphosphate synthase
MTDIKARLADTAAEVEDALADLLPKPTSGGEPLAEARVIEAMRYACQGGKRLRAFLVLETAAAFGVSRDRAMRAACAIECIHAYSLVHDDLPSMDNDDLRRGRPTTHRQFDEATAILAGDALQTHAFSLLADDRTHENAFVRVQLIAAIAQASGAGGMVGGQMIDIEAETAETPLLLPEVTRLQRMKTGALIEVSCRAGGILGKASASNMRFIEGYARDFGLVFQIVDDLLDIEGDAATVGKAVGKDTGKGKATFVSILGVKDAKDRAERLTAQAIAHITPLGDRSLVLADLAKYALSRKN